MDYYNKALGVQNQKLPTYEKEFMAVMMAVDKWRSYLNRGPSVIKTDHKSLCNLEDQVLHTELQKKAMAKLAGLQFKFQYKKGTENKAADALSRVGHVFAVQAVSTAQPVWLQEVVNSYAVDTRAQELLTKLAITAEDEPGFSLSQGLIRFKGKVWVGSNSGLHTKLIEAFHASYWRAQWYSGHIPESKEVVSLDGNQARCSELCPTVPDLSTSKT